MFESIIKKFKTFKKERRLSFLKDKRFEQYVVMICKLINLQIDLCKEHLSSKITKSKLKTILNSDWVYGYILGTTMAFINETYLRRKTRGHLFAMISVLHNLGIVKNQQIIQLLFGIILKKNMKIKTQNIKKDLRLVGMNIRIG